MVAYQQWTAIAFELAADEVPATEVISRAAQLWRANKQDIQRMNMTEARSYGRDVL